MLLFTLLSILPSLAAPFLLPLPTPFTSSLSAAYTTDVLILGSGPSSLSIAALLAQSSNPPSITLASATLDSNWIPNYGVWESEWTHLASQYTALGVSFDSSCINRRWSDTECFFKEPTPELLNRAYLRIAPVGLRTVLMSCLKCPHVNLLPLNVAHKVIAPNIYTPPVAFAKDTTTVTLTDGSTVTAKIVLDGTGAESRFTVRSRAGEGYQIAYGVDCEVKGEGVTATSLGDYSKEKMTLFDFRTDATSEKHSSAGTAPTFNYVMPLYDNRVFLEETSLVANPAVSFKECRDRLATRMERMGLAIETVHEEEFCYIPMGGGTPVPGQRIVAVGAAAGLVHPATGYQLCRTLEANLGVAAAVREVLGEGGGADEMAERIVGAIWTKEGIRQRAFSLFGGDFLMKQDAVGLQGFFDGFFKVDLDKWSGYLAGYGKLPGNDRHDSWFKRLNFGVSFLLKLPPKVGLDLVASIVGYSLKGGPALVQSVTPLLGAPRGYEGVGDWRKEVGGDETVKREFRELAGGGKEGEDVK